MSAARGWEQGWRVPVLGRGVSGGEDVLELVGTATELHKHAKNMLMNRTLAKSDFYGL